MELKVVHCFLRSQKKTYDSNDKQGLRKLLRRYGVNKKILEEFLY